MSTEFWAAKLCVEADASEAEIREAYLRQCAAILEEKKSLEVVQRELEAKQKVRDS